MNKKNKILVGCLALLLVLSVGYALFSDTITINGTATAKGSFDISGSCQSGIPSELVSGLEFVTHESKSEEQGYKNDYCSFDGNKGTITVDFEYPGAMRYFTIKLTNTGSITAKVNPSEITYNGNFCGNNDQSGTYDSDDCVDSSSPGYKYVMGFSEPVIVGIQIGDGNIISYDKITQEQGKLFMDDEGNYLLEPGNSSYFVIGTALSSLIGKEEGGMFETKADATYTFPFTQVTQ